MNDTAIPKLPSLTHLNKVPSFDALRIDVPAKGEPLMARFALVGEAPGSTEMLEHKPFVGPAGKIEYRARTSAGIANMDCYITNVCKTQLPENNTDELWTIKGYRHPYWDELRRNLIAELAGTSAKVVVAYGATAFMALRGNLPAYTITQCRGSVYSFEDIGIPELAGRYLIPTFHPAAALNRGNPKNFFVIYKDLLKALDIEQAGYIPEPPIQMHIEPTFHEAMEFLSTIKDGMSTSVDIECLGKSISCIGFTRGGFEDVMCIPFYHARGNYFSEGEELEIWREIARILESSLIRKIFQNAMFDVVFLLIHMGIKTDNIWFDIMLGHHVCWADLPKGLDFLTAWYTFHPYYKDEGKNWRTVHRGDYRKFWEYNAKDAAYTHEIVPAVERELEALGYRTQFDTKVMSLFGPLIEMQWRGHLMDKFGIARDGRTLIASVAELQKELDTIVGAPINANSPAQLKKYFYGRLGIPAYLSRNKNNRGAETTNDLAMKKLAKKGYREAQLIRDIRGIRKMYGTYYQAELDYDNRIRCSFNIAGTETGRLSSSSTIFGTGTNLQNQPKSFRKYFIADPGKVLMEVDLSQAEARVVAYLSEDETMMHGFEAGLDVHTFNASNIFGYKYDELKALVDAEDTEAKAKRQLGKKVVHASNYDMGPQTFADQTDLTFGEAKSLLNKYHARYPGLKRMHAEVRNKLNNGRILYNLYGRPKRFLGALRDDTFKSAYAFTPQSTVGENLNTSLADIYYDPRFLPFTLHLTVHDSVLVQFDWPDSPAVLLDHMNLFKSVMEKPLTIKGRTFTIPVDFAIGLNWKNKHEVKIPTLEACEDVLNKLECDYPAYEEAYLANNYHRRLTCGNAN